MGSAVFKTMLCDAMQHLALYNLNNSIATLLLRNQKMSVALSFILGKVTAQVGLDIFLIRSCAVQSTVAMARLTAVLDFVVTVNSLIVKRPWYHSRARFFLSIFVTPLLLSLLSPLESAASLIIPHSRCSSLFLPVISPIL